MQNFQISYYISKDGSNRQSQVTSGQMIIDANSEEEAVRLATEVIEGVTGEKVLECWVPLSDEAVKDAPEVVKFFHHYLDEEK